MYENDMGGATGRLFRKGAGSKQSSSVPERLFVFKPPDPIRLDFEVTFVHYTPWARVA